MINRLIPLFLTGLLFVFSACEKKMSPGEIAQIGIASCRNLAPFIKKTQLDPSRSGFSTNESDIKGIVLVQFPSSPTDSAAKKTWQHPTWSQYGWMGSITTDNLGNAYTAPLPKVNTFDNPLSQMNRIYKIDANTGEMSLFTILPLADTTRGVVPFAVLGVYYDCHGSKLYASSVAGSTRDVVKGVIYMIDPLTGKVEDTFEGYDAMGVFVGGVTGEKRLFFGDGRSSQIYSVALTKDGRFKGKASMACTLDQLGPRGDDKARRIRFDNLGNMIVLGVEFNYSLAAQSEKPETPYQFRYNHQEQKWETVTNP